MTKIPRLWARLNHLVPNPQCRTFGDDFDLIQWNDSRLQPTASALLALNDADINQAADGRRKDEQVDLDDPNGLLEALALVVFDVWNGDPAPPNLNAFKARIRAKLTGSGQD